MTEKTVERDSDTHLQLEKSAETQSICNVKSAAPAEAVIDDIEILDVDISDRNASLDLMMQKHAEAPLMAQ